MMAAPCIFYMSGLIDGLLYSGYIGTSICLPPETRLPTAVDIVVDYLKSHPDDLQRPAVPMIARALANAFPCRTPK
jgi:hypothetical protein